MLKHLLIHPKINEVIGRAGHHGKILIADGNYPASSKKGPNAELVCLNLMPGVVTCTQVLRAVLSAVPIEAVNTMMYETERPLRPDRRPARLGRVSRRDPRRRARPEAGADREVGLLQGGGDARPRPHDPDRPTSSGSPTCCCRSASGWTEPAHGPDTDRRPPALLAARPALRLRWLDAPASRRSAATSCPRTWSPGS